MTTTVAKQKTAYIQLKEAILPHMTAYQTDLTKIDRQLLRQNPGARFLHWARETGTHIVFLRDAADYPAPGEHVPYLFGTADRHKLLNEAVTMAEYFLNPLNPVVRVHYFCGRKLRQITPDQALEIARDHRQRIEAEWKRR